MTPEEKQKLIEAFTTILDQEKPIRFASFRRAIEVAPDNGFKRYKPDETTYIWIVVGPPTDFEREVELALRRFCELNQ